MKRLMSLLRSMFADASMWCCVNSTRDLETVARRVEDEGLSFLTITLPGFCKDFERSLDQERVDPSCFRGFSKHGELPRFLGGFLDLVFDRHSGRLRNEPSKPAIFFIRQLTLAFKKMALPCTKERTDAAIEGYIACEKELKVWEEGVARVDLHRFSRAFALLFRSANSAIDSVLAGNGHLPKHGPGTTADKLIGNNKFKQVTWTTRLETSFPAELFMVPNQGFYEHLQGLNFLEPDAEQPVRVVTVPKTLKTPRIIAIEPTCMQYAQQSLMELFVNTLESDDKLLGCIGFTDQRPNQVFAQAGSADGSLATLDLSEASDRVSNLLVRTAFAPWPHLDAALQNSRSTRADVPGKGVHTLTKFASMGSAVCFPVEAMMFLTIIALAKEQQLSRTLTSKDLASLLKVVRVYGDDLIVPNALAPYVGEQLKAFGFKLNANKSFWTGRFRESCGRDYYDGEDVSVTYVRHMIPHSRHNASEIVSLYSLRNQLYKAGMWESTRTLDAWIGRLAPAPLVSERSPVLGRHSFLGYQTQKLCRNLHVPLVRGLVVKIEHRKSPLSGPGALMKFFLKRGSQPIFDVKHLERYGRPERVSTKVRWGCSA